MSRISSRIPNLINGVSQQAPALRLPTQGKSQTNFYSTVLDGLVPRPPLQWVAKVASTIPSSALFHAIVRDDTEKYFGIFSSSGVRVFTFDGVEKTVTNLGSSYLDGLSNPAEDLSAITVADYTFIVNKRKKVLEAGSSTPPTDHEALVNVTAGNYGKTYKITIDGSVVAEYQTPDGSTASHTSAVDTVWIADQLRQDLVAAGYNTSPWSVGRYHSTLHIKNTSTDFSIAVEDGYNGNNMKAIKEEHQKFTDLPSYGPEGFTVKITASDETGYDDYWVSLTKTNSANNFGTWEEVKKPGVATYLDASTMPHALVKNTDGSFTFKPLVWDIRKTGDEEGNPPPSFVGSYLSKIIFHRGRLGVLCDENVVFSRSGHFFDFYRQTMTALLDDDPLDIATTHTKVSILNHAVPFQEMLILWSDRCQFRLAGNDLLTAKTASLKPTTEYPNSPRASPVVSGDRMFYVVDRGDWSGLYEYIVDKAVETGTAAEVSSHVPEYIPSGVFRLQSAPEHEVLVMLSSKEPNTLTLYKYFNSNQEKLQSAFFKWVFPGVTEILDIQFDKHKLFLITKRHDGVHIEYIRIDQGGSDSGLSYYIRLDQRILYTPTLLSEPPFGSVIETITSTIPVNYDTGVSVVGVTAAGGAMPPGREVSISRSGASITVPYEYRDQPIYIGIKFSSTYEFSPFVYRRTMPNGGTVPEMNGRCQVSDLALFYDASTYFSVEVTPHARGKRTYTFEGRVVSDFSTPMDSLPLSSGRFSVPIMSRGDRAEVSITTDSWSPLAITSAEWRGTFNPNNRQM